MKDPNAGCSEDVLNRLKEASYEKLRIEIFNAVKQLMNDFGMTWDDLAEKILRSRNGAALKYFITQEDISLSTLNQIAHCFSAEAVIIFRHRPPFTKT